jgi:hypothetical protein
LNPTKRPENRRLGGAHASPGRRAAGAQIVDVDYEHVDDRGQVIERWPGKTSPAEDHMYGSTPGNRLAVFGHQTGVPAFGRAVRISVLVLAIAVLAGASTQLIYSVKAISVTRTPGLDGEISLPIGSAEPRTARVESRPDLHQAEPAPERPRRVRDYPSMIVSLSGGGTGH